MADPAAEEIVLAEAALDRALVQMCRLMAIDPEDVRRGLAEAIESETRRIRAQALGQPELPDSLRPLLDQLSEDSPCRFDHHGYCQEHLAGEVDGECANAVARRLLGPEVTGAG